MIGKGSITSSFPEGKSSSYAAPKKRVKSLPTSRPKRARKWRDGLENGSFPNTRQRIERLSWRNWFHRRRRRPCSVRDSSPPHNSHEAKRLPLLKNSRRHHRSWQLRFFP